MADTKDWTWVLHRPCPDCGLDTSTVRPETIGSRLRENAAAWHGVLEHPAATERPSAEVWSALEYACHVRDVFRIFDVRLTRMRREDDPLFDNWDQDAAAESERYGEQDPERVRDEIDAAVDALARNFDGVGPAELARPGRRSDGAVFTVESLGRYLVHDPVHHLWDVTGTAGR